MHASFFIDCTNYMNDMPFSLNFCKRRPLDFEPYISSVISTGSTKINEIVKRSVAESSPGLRSIFQRGPGVNCAMEDLEPQGQ